MTCRHMNTDDSDDADDERSDIVYMYMYIHTQTTNEYRLRVSLASESHSSESASDVLRTMLSFAHTPTIKMRQRFELEFRILRDVSVSYWYMGRNMGEHRTRMRMHIIDNNASEKHET